MSSSIPATDATSLAIPGVSLPDGVAPALNNDQAAAYTGLKPTTLEGLRHKGGGPRFVKYGRRAVRYLVRDLDEWMASLTVGSTSEAA
jgi:predicted DNA-binding transcriptional regulator AlpA